MRTFLQFLIILLGLFFGFVISKATDSLPVGGLVSLGWCVYFWLNDLRIDISNEVYSLKKEIEELKNQKNGL